MFQLPFKVFIEQFGVRIGISNAEKDALYANVDSYTGIVKIKPVDKIDIDEMLQVLQNA